MAAQITKPYRNTLSGSIGAGMGSIFAPGGRKYYILEHKVSSKYHKAGEAQEIIVDNIEIGRDSHCQVRFDDSFSTVSRHHAGIVKDGDGWKLVQISTTNSTLLNGVPMKQREWYLQNGDEIQLSVNGPKLGFILPTGKKSTVGSIGLTRRLSLFRQQALRPYKTAITVLSCVLVAAILGLGTWALILQGNYQKQSLMLALQIEKGEKTQEELDKLTKQLDEANAKITAQEKEKSDLETRLKKMAGSMAKLQEQVENISVGSSGGGEIAKTFDDTYVIDCFPIINGNAIEELGWGGTGFMLDNGCFITAQHVINGFSIVTKIVKNSKGNPERIVDPDALENKLNAVYYSGKLTILMICESPSDRFEIKYTYDEVKTNMGDPLEIYTGIFQDEAGRNYPVRRYRYGNGDWACFQVGKRGSLPFDPEFSRNMPVQTKLTIVGFPTKQGISTKGTINPIVSEAITARQGLEDDGTIKTANDNSDHGNSGGPVYAYKDGRYVVVGILVGTNRGEDSMKGRVVPIGAVFK